MLSFEPSEEQKTLVDSVRRFAARELRAHAREADERSELPPDLMAAGSELALLPASLPEAYGGFGERSAVTGALFAEELAWGDLSGALALLAPRHDFDPWQVQTRATRDGDGYVLEGAKCNVPCAATAEWTLVYAAL